MGPKVTNFLKRIPILCGLIGCTRENHIETSKEVFSNTVIGFMPVWLGGWILYVTDTKSLPEPSFITSMLSTVRQGELYMYCTAILAPVFYLALKQERRMKRFPGAHSHILFVVIILVICAVAFGLLRAGVGLNQGFIFKFSVYLFCFSFVLSYLASVYDKSRGPSAADEAKKEEDDFAGKFDEHRNPTK